MGDFYLESVDSVVNSDCPESTKSFLVFKMVETEGGV